MVTQATPSPANWAPSHQGEEPVPAYSNIPPAIQTMTGRPAAPRSGVQMLSDRQSSPRMVGPSGIITAISGGICGWGGAGLKARASRTPLHGVTGWGGRSRLAPNGGAAYGTPLKTFTPADNAPRTAPDRVLTTGSLIIALIC